MDVVCKLRPMDVAANLFAQLSFFVCMILNSILPATRPQNAKNKSIRKRQILELLYRSLDI